MAKEYFPNEGTRQNPRTAKWHGDEQLPEFRVVIVKMSQELGKRMDAQSKKLQEVFNKEPENTKNKKSWRIQ